MPRLQNIRGRLLAALFCWGLASAASAHGARQDVRVDMAALPAPGLSVELHQDFLAPQLVVSNPSGKLLEILDDEGRAFIRIGPKGAEGDLAAKAFHLSRISGGGDARANTLSATPRWRPVATEPAYGWFDARLATSTLDIPYAVKQIGEEMPFQQWRIPARLDGKPIELKGVFTYTPPPKGLTVTSLLNAAAMPKGVTVQLTSGPVPALFLSNRSAQTVAVLDDAGQPFLKIGPDGVWADVGSVAWRASRTSGNSAGGKTGWQQLSKSPSHSWLEPRAAYRGKPPAAAGWLNEWSLPLLIGAQKAELRGANHWVVREQAPAKAAAR